MRAHLSNAVYGVIDYAAYPVGMLLVAPIVLHKLGVAEYGIWTVATAAVSTGGIIASGFGDANIQQIAKLRAAGNTEALENSVRSILGINLVLGALLACAGWLLSPYAARHIAASAIGLEKVCLLSLRIASFLMLVRALESVCISTVRAFEQYGAAVRISLAARILTLGVAAMLAYFGFGTGYLMEATALILVVGTCLQFMKLHKFLGNASLMPTFNRDAMRGLVDFGAFSWLQAVAGVMFGQVDRLLLGVSLGAVAVASYALCIQLAQPVYGMTASCLHFLFPYLSGKVGVIAPKDIARTVLKAIALNFVIVAGGTLVLVMYGDRILHGWAGNAIAGAAAPIFPIIVLGSALLGLSVTATYTLLALGRIRTVAWLSIASGIAMLLMMWWLLPRQGIYGLAIARLCYGSFSLLLYVAVLRSLKRPKHLLTSSLQDLVALDEASSV
jgi:O-antigen/teichoic acid export membrane protein